MANYNEDIFIEERRVRIFEYINEVEKASIEDIMSCFRISKSTVRRDLIELEKNNLIIRTRGGAFKKKFFKYEFNLEEKKVLNIDKKKKIAQTVKKYINNGDVIYISGGTTTLELAKLLCDVNDLIIFTNAINILLEVITNSNIKVKLLGGDFRKKTFSLVGQDTIEFMQKYNFEKAFIGANGFSIDEGFTTPNELEAKVDREVINRSKKTFFLIDDSKFGAVAFSVICKTEKVDYIITDKELNSDLSEKLKAKGIKVITR